MMRQSAMMARRALPVRAMDWNALAGKVSSDAARAEVSRLRELHGDLVSQAKAYEGAPEPIDFAHYRNVIKTPGIVDTVENAYNALTLPQFVNEVAGEADEAYKTLVSEAESAMNASAARLEELEAMIADAKTQVTTKETTVDEVLQRYPEIAKEIDQEIKEHEWWKSV